MRVILTQDVPKLGNVGDVCTVKPGFGRNYLLPQGLAMLATTGGLGIVLLAIVLDRITQAMGEPRRGNQRWWQQGPLGLLLHRK